MHGHGLLLGSIFAGPSQVVTLCSSVRAHCCSQIFVLTNNEWLCVPVCMCTCMGLECMQCGQDAGVLAEAVHAVGELGWPDSRLHAMAEEAVAQGGAAQVGGRGQVNWCIMNVLYQGLAYIMYECVDGGMSFVR